MKTLHLIYLTFLQLLRQLRALPHTLANAARLRRLQVARNDAEVERLDRIRNPSKFRGK